MKLHINRTTLSGLLFASLALLGSCDGSSTAPTSPSTTKSEPAKTPLVQKAAVADWCPEHGVPESICTRCNAKLSADFQAKGDWCKEHTLPESQCLVCHPDLKPKLEALRPKSGG